MNPHLRTALGVIAIGLTASACAKKAPASVADVLEDLDFAMTPRLPSPEAGTYALSPEVPQDQVTGEMLRGKPYDGSLAGAAAGLALSLVENEGGMSRWELREALWRAGFPYPVYDARSWTVGLNQAPTRDVITWLDALTDDQPMALVRARGRDFDAWVGIRANPEVDLGTVPRMATLGTPVVLPPTPGATWRASDAAGDTQEGPLDDGAMVNLTSSGEWMVEIRQGRKELAKFPIYVDIEPPTVPLMRLSGIPQNVSSSLDADVLTRRLLDHIRTAYGMYPWLPSPIFDAALGRYMEDPSKGSKAVLQAMGFEDATSIVWACDQVTVENCFDSWVWDVRRRRTLLTDEVDSYGLHVALDARGVHITLLLVDADP